MTKENHAETNQTKSCTENECLHIKETLDLKITAVLEKTFETYTYIPGRLVTVLVSFSF